jgi:cytochrome P450
LPWIEKKCQREALRPGSFGAQIYDAADAGGIPLEDAPLLLWSFLSAGLDTTMSALGTMFYRLATHPQQWQLLKNDYSPALIRPTFDEAAPLIAIERWSCNVIQNSQKKSQRS